MGAIPLMILYQMTIFDKKHGSLIDRYEFQAISNWEALQDKEAKQREMGDTFIVSVVRITPV